MKGRQDIEYIELRNRFLLGLSVAVILMALGTLLFVKRFNIFASTNGNIKHNDTYVVFIKDDPCDNCSNVVKKLESKNIEFESLYENSSTAEELIHKNKIISNDGISPAILYYKKGKLYSYLVNIRDDEELDIFIKKVIKK